MGSSTIQWNLRPVVKYHLRRGVGFMKFLENGSRPQPPTSPEWAECPWKQQESPHISLRCASSVVYVLFLLLLLLLYCWASIGVSGKYSKAARWCLGIVTAVTLDTGRRRVKGCLEFQVMFCKRATNYKVLLRNLTCEDKASYASTPPSTSIINTFPWLFRFILSSIERWGAGVETQKNVRGEVGGWGRGPFNEPCAPSLSTIYDGA